MSTVSDFKRNSESDRFYEFRCHDGNYSMAGILAGARRAQLNDSRDSDSALSVKEKQSRAIVVNSFLMIQPVLMLRRLSKREQRTQGALCDDKFFSNRDLVKSQSKETMKRWIRALIFQFPDTQS